jgi:glucarate dehydratase
MKIGRRDLLGLAAGGLVGLQGRRLAFAGETERAARSLRITGLKVVPIALPDPPLLASSGCHGPYFLRHIVVLETDAGITGVGETHGGESVTAALERAREAVAGKSPFAYQLLAAPLADSPEAYAALEVACLDACGKALGLRLADLLGGAVRDEVEVAAYLFYRYAADHPAALSDPHRVDGGRPVDDWGEVRSPAAMADLAAKFRERWGFRVLKLKGGVLSPEVELETMQALRSRLGDGPLRIDPNGVWGVETALRIGRELRQLPLEYYEDPVSGQEAMARVRRETGLRMSTNMCVTRFAHIPEAARREPIDVVLADHHYWGGIPACQALGRICEAAGWGVSQHSNNHTGISMAAMLHVAACVPQLTYASDTHYPWLPPGADLIEGPNLAIQGGRMKLPGGPGLGVTLDLDKLARAHEVFKKCGLRGRDDASTMRRFEPGWERRTY